ncbi:hypothetical protein PaG_05293 [Moesziomyces aphidis]|uniref:Uncharacterized protein n=1 Tax=Moesziomyces aphidis TaxID=84754 RepID=W3VFM5_MOEAP|nr:hypothetical protein PaG_05293 [Moesziomyces aphidis]
MTPGPVPKSAAGVRATRADRSPNDERVRPTKELLAKAGIASDLAPNGNKVHRLARSASALLSSAACAGFLMDTEWRTPKAALSRRPGRRRSSATPLPGRPPHPIPFNPPDIRGGEGSAAPSASAGRAPLFSVSHPDQELSLGLTAAQTSTPRLALVTRPPPTVTLSHALAH